MDDIYKTINGTATGIFKDRGSKFFSYAYHAETEEEVKQLLSVLKDKHYSARHFCYAYYLDPLRKCFRVNDDGEPSSSAGRPIQGQILSHDLTEILIVVVRYFGGIKLGVPGLINAYRTAAAEAIGNAHIIEKEIKAYFDIEFDYLVLNNVMRLIKEFQIQVLERDFENICSMKLSIKRSEASILEERLRQIETLLIKN